MSTHHEDFKKAITEGNFTEAELRSLLRTALILKRRVCR